MSIPTPAGRRQLARRLDYQQKQVDHFLDRMRTGGDALLAFFQLGKLYFQLSDGTVVPRAIGYLLAEHENVAVVDPPLIPGGLPQRFRFTPAKRGENNG